MLLACWWAAKFDSLRHEENIRKQYTTVAQDAQQLNSRVSQILNDPKRSQLQICKGQIFFCVLMFHMVYIFLACQSKRSECALSRSAFRGWGWRCLDVPWCWLVLRCLGGWHCTLESHRIKFMGPAVGTDWFESSLEVMIHDLLPLILIGASLHA